MDEKILVVAEKPSVGRDIARILGCKQKKDGYIEGEKYVVTWGIGHLVTLYEPEDYDPQYKRWTLKNLPFVPEEMKLKVSGKVKKQFDIIKMLMNSTAVNLLICATDAGREGELIFRYIYQLAGCSKPFERLWISSMVDSAVKEGFSNLRPGSDYDNLFESARCRSEADWLVGINATRAYTVRNRSLLSVGRVQTPTLAIMVKRQEEIDSFVPRDYWEIRADYGNFTGLWYDPETRETRSYDREHADSIAAKVKDRAGFIKDVKEEARRELPPQLYDLNELQRDANKRFGFSAKKTLSVAQNLYEKHKVITYPRTDSRHLTSDMVPGLKKLIKKVGDSSDAYREYVSYLLGLPKLPVNKRIVNDSKVTDHHAIIPTGKIAALPPDENKIFGLICVRLFAAFYLEHKYTATTITAEIEGEQFISRGRTIQQEGWKALYKKPAGEKKDADSDDGGEQNLPPVKKEDPVHVADTEVLQKQTRPPSPYTEAGLLYAMENAGRFVEDDELKEHLKERGLGTPATRAGIIERLISVGYLERKGKKLIPTQKGIDLINMVPPELKSPEMTGEWEQGLNHISRGKMSSAEFMDNIKKYTGFVVKAAREADITPSGDKRETAARDADESTGKVLGRCPSCGEGEVVIKPKNYGCSRWKEGCSFSIGQTILGRRLPEEEVSNLINNGETGMIEGFTSKKGKKFNARLTLQENARLKFEFK